MMMNTLADQGFFGLAHRERIKQLIDGSHTPLTVRSTLAAAVGICGKRRTLAVATDPAVTSGAIGVSEARELRVLIARAQREALALVLLIDSAGARVNEGVAIQGALRCLFADLLAARAAGLRVVAILGRNVFGGASMLAMLCESRVYAEGTRLAMTGPAVLKTRNRVSPQHVARTIAAANRLERDGRDGLLAGGDAIEPSQVRAMLRQALDDDPRDYDSWRTTVDHQMRARLADFAAADTAGAVEIVAPGTVKLCGARWAGADDVIRVIDALQQVAHGRDRITIDCEWAGHSMRLVDEDALLSQYLAHLCSVIHAIETRGTRVHLNITGELSGGLYIALAGASSVVRLAAGGRVQTLPPEVLDSFAKMPVTREPDPDTLIAYGVIDVSDR